MPRECNCNFIFKFEYVARLSRFIAYNLVIIIIIIVKWAIFLTRPGGDRLFAFFFQFFALTLPHSICSTYTTNFFPVWGWYGCYWNGWCIRKMNKETVLSRRQANVDKHKFYRRSELVKLKFWAFVLRLSQKEVWPEKLTLQKPSFSDNSMMWKVWAVNFFDHSC